jgi:hypothetical protein
MAASLTLQITSVDLVHPLGYAGQSRLPGCTSGLPSLTPKQTLTNPFTNHVQKVSAACWMLEQAGLTLSLRVCSLVALPGTAEGPMVATT